MKISYRDKILLIIMVVLLTGFFGYLLLIKPKTEDIEINNSKYAAAEEKQDEINNKLNKLKNVNKQITEYEAKTENITSRFLAHSRDFEVDRFVQEMLDVNQMDLGMLGISDLEVVDLKPYKAEIVYLSYPLLNGKPATYSDDAKRQLDNQTDTSGHTPLLSYSIELRFEGNQANVENFLNGFCAKEKMSIVVEEYRSEIGIDGKTKGTVKFKIFFLQPKEIKEAN